MGFDIFRVDWILVSSIIIIGLIVFLIVVKIYKILTRWRYTFANEDIYLSSYKSIERENESAITECWWNYVINSKLMDKNNLTVIILHTKRRINLFKIITEGLSSYGLRVINVLLSFNNKPSLDSSKNDINDVIKNIINSILRIIPESTNNDNFLLLSYDDKNLNPISISNEKNYHGHIIINSKTIFKEENKKMIKDVGNNSVNNIYLIFSEYKILKIKNKIIEKCYRTKYSKNSILVSNATRNFKYFETILFGIILNLINKINNKRVDNG